MNQQDLFALKKSLITMSAMYGRQLDDGVLTMYVRHLQNYDIASVLSALEQLTQNQKIRSMPLIADVLQALDPKATDRDNAVSLANEILNLVIKRGSGWTEPCFIHGGQYFQGSTEYFHTYEEAITDALGDAGAEVVRIMGGWRSVCDQFNESDTAIVKAQVRELVEACIRKSAEGTLNKPLQLKKSPAADMIGLLAAKKSF